MAQWRRMNAHCNMSVLQHWHLWALVIALPRASALPDDLETSKGITARMPQRSHSLRHKHTTATGSLRRQGHIPLDILLVLVPQQLRRNDQVIPRSIRKLHRTSKISLARDKMDTPPTQRNKHQELVPKHLHKRTHHDLHNQA